MVTLESIEAGIQADIVGCNEHTVDCREHQDRLVAVRTAMALEQIAQYLRIQVIIQEAGNEDYLDSMMDEDEFIDGHVTQIA